MRSQDYWKPDRPHLDEVVIPYVTDDNTRILKLQGGEVDAAVAIPYAQIEQLDAQDDIDVLIEPLFRFDGMWLNHAEKPLDDVKVRQALNYATDKESMLKSIYFDKVEIANHMMPKMKYWREDVAPYEYDPEKATSLIGESSAADGFTLPIVIPTGDVIIQQIAQILKESYSAIGVDVQITNLDIGTAYTNFSGFNYEAERTGTSRATSPRPTSSPRSSSTTARRAGQSRSSRTTTARRRRSSSRRPPVPTTLRGSSCSGSSNSSSWTMPCSWRSSSPRRALRSTRM